MAVAELATHQGKKLGRITQERRFDNTKTAGPRTLVFRADLEEAEVKVELVRVQAG